MRIIQFGPYPINSNSIRGGVEASVYGLATELARQGQIVHVFDFPRVDNKDTEEDDGLLVIHRYKNPGKRNLDMLKRAMNLVQDILTLAPDVVHIHGTGELSSSIYRTLKQAGVPVMLTIHGLARIEKRNMIRQALQDCQIKKLIKLVLQYIRQNREECRLLEEADMAIVDTGYLLDALKDYPVKNLPKLHVIPQGANDKFFSAKRLQIDGKKTILCVGAFSRRKRQVLLIKAFEKLRENGVDAKLVFCGAVSETDYYNEVNETISASEYCSDIILYINKPQEFILEQYQKASVFALHSQEESQGIVFVEAMACGLPVVSTRVGGIPYVVENGKTGLLTEFGDIETTALALEKLLLDERLYQKYSEAAIKAVEKYRWRNIANEILKIYKKN